MPARRAREAALDIRIYVDFDGTVTQHDSLVYLLDRYVGPSWLEIEHRIFTIPGKEHELCPPDAGHREKK